MTVRQYLASMSSADIVESMAFDRIEVPEDWQRHAHLCHHIEQTVHGDKARPYETFLPQRYRPKPKPMTPAQMKARIMAGAKAGKRR